MAREGEGREGAARGTRRSRHSFELQRALDSAESVYISCCICGGTVWTQHRHIVTEQIYGPLAYLYRSFPSAEGRLAIGKEVCCRHFVDGHHARIKNTGQINREANVATVFSWGTRSDRRAVAEVSGAAANSARGCDDASKGSADHESSRPKRRTRSSYGHDSASNQDIDRLVAQGLPQHLVPQTDSVEYRAIIRWVADRFDIQAQRDLEQRAELERCRLQVEAAKWPLRFENIHRDCMLEAFTGMSRHDFNGVLDAYVSFRSARGRRPDRQISDQTRVLITMAWLGRATSCSIISDLSHYPESTIKHIVTSTIATLSSAYSEEIYFPPLDELIDTCHSSFNALFPDFASCLIPDGTSLVLSSPLRSGKDYYCPYKAHHCLRYFILVDTNGLIVYVSDVYDGSVTDSTMWKESGVVQLVADAYGGDLRARASSSHGGSFQKLAIAGDKGYSNAHIDTNIMHLLVTSSATETADLRLLKSRRKHVTFSKTLAPIRSVVERTIRRLKIFQRLGSNNQITQNPTLYDAIKFAAGYINKQVRSGQLVLAHSSSS
jgi:hypothetical protein